MGASVFSTIAALRADASTIDARADERDEHARPAKNVVIGPRAHALGASQHRVDLAEQGEHALDLARFQRGAQLNAVKTPFQRRGAAGKAGLDVPPRLPEYRAHRLQRLPVGVGRAAGCHREPLGDRRVEGFRAARPSPARDLDEQARLFEHPDVVIDGAGRPAQVCRQLAGRRAAEGGESLDDFQPGRRDEQACLAAVEHERVLARSTGHIIHLSKNLNLMSIGLNCRLDKGGACARDTHSG